MHSIVQKNAELVPSTTFACLFAKYQKRGGSARYMQYISANCLTQCVKYCNDYKQASSNEETIF